jgi:hypothetical protein
VSLHPKLRTNEITEHPTPYCPNNNVKFFIQKPPKATIMDRIFVSDTKRHIFFFKLIDAWRCTREWYRDEDPHLLAIWQAAINLADEEMPVLDEVCDLSYWVDIHKHCMSSIIRAFTPESLRMDPAEAVERAIDILKLTSNCISIEPLKSPAEMGFLLHVGIDGGFGL